MIEENTKKLLEEIPATNPFGEKVTLVAAVKLQTADSINRAICGGITDIGDNHVQEFRDKYELINGNPADILSAVCRPTKSSIFWGKSTCTTRLTGTI